MLLPMKMSMIQAMSKRDSFVVEDIMEELRPLYGKERQFNYKEFSSCFHAMRAEGLIDRIEAFQDEAGELSERYKISANGISRLKMIPKR